MTDHAEHEFLTMEEVEESLSSFGVATPTRKLFRVVPGFTPDDAQCIIRCTLEYLKHSMTRAVGDDGLPVSEAWVNGMLIEMIEALSYVDGKQQAEPRK